MDSANYRLEQYPRYQSEYDNPRDVRRRHIRRPAQDRGACETPLHASSLLSTSLHSWMLHAAHTHKQRLLLTHTAALNTH